MKLVSNKLKRRALAASVMLITSISGCSTTGLDRLMAEDAPRDFDSMYLRGVFSWWEPDENYRLVQVNDRLYSASVELVADGQPYDFRFADSSWTPGLTCGASEDEDDQTLSLGDEVEGDCIDGQRNFKFTPKQNGVYQFFIDFSDQDSPEVFIKLAD